MNGRVYDPVLGMMLSPDNYVQNAAGTNNYNRYAYCVNNPLAYVDQNGNFFWIPLLIGALVGGYGGYEIGHAHHATGWNMTRYILEGAAIGGTVGYGAAIMSAAGNGSFIVGALSGAVENGAF